MDSVTLKNVLSRSIMYETNIIENNINKLCLFKICDLPENGYFKFFITFKESVYTTIEFEISNRNIVRHFCPNLGKEYLIEVSDNGLLHVYYKPTEVSSFTIELEYATNYVDNVYNEISLEETEKILVKSGVVYFNNNINLAANQLNLNTLNVETLTANINTNTITIGNWTIKKSNEEGSKLKISLLNNQ